MKTKSANQKAICDMSPIDSETDAVQVIVETPRNSRNKFRFDEESGLFELGSVLPAGSAFPYDFGFVPGTRAEDGDPIDVLLLMDASAFPGCRVRSRLIGVIEAEQTEDEETERNDRLVAVATDSHDYRELKSLKDISPNLLEELEHFFVSYNEMRGKRFKLLGHRGPKQAQKLLKQAMKMKRKRNGRK
jgi:inorganic pyrophosphatase